MEKIRLNIQVEGLSEAELLARLQKSLVFAASGKSGLVERMMRYGRWGTCVECPRDEGGGIAPERCVNTRRYDHQIDATPDPYYPTE